MGYGKRKPAFKILGGWVSIPWDILNSNAYIDLSASAAKALPLFLGKVKHNHKTGIEYSSPQYYGFEFTYSFKEANKHFAFSTFEKIIPELINKGFIDPVYRGGRKSEGLGYHWYRLSPRWIDYGKAEFDSINWEDFKIKKPRTRTIEEARTFLPPDQFETAKTQIKRCFPTSKSEITRSKKGNNDTHQTGKKGNTVK